MSMSLTVQEIIQSKRPESWKQNKLNQKMVKMVEPTINITLKDKLMDADIIGNEVKLNEFELNEVKDIINKVKDFKQLCANCSNELIIAVICFRTKRRYNKRCHIERYAAWEKYGINWRIYSLISDRIGYYYQKRTFINNSI